MEVESDERAFWLEILADGLLPATKTEALLKEAGELTAITVASRKTLVRNNRK